MTTDPELTLAQLQSAVYRYRYGPRRERPRVPVVVASWMWDELERRGAPWFIAGRDSGLIVRNEPS